MIIVRSPFRISFAGGGSDLPQFYTKHEGAVISTTIDKFIYITLHESFHRDSILLKYSKTENVKDVRKIKNSIARSIISDYKVNSIGIETIGDIPAKTGLGSSSSFAVGLHHALSVYTSNKTKPIDLAEKACSTEIEKLGSPIGKQDQYAAAFGGFKFYKFLSSGEVVVEEIKISSRVKRNLESNLLMFYTGITRSANSILERQNDGLKNSQKSIENTKKMVDIAYKMKSSLEKNDISSFGSLLNEGWKIKQQMATNISSKRINKYYDLGISAGATGGKLLGAGGGGFLLFYCEKNHQESLRKKLFNLREVKFIFTKKGSEVIFKE